MEAHLIEALLTCNDGDPEPESEYLHKDSYPELVRMGLLRVDEGYKITQLGRDTLILLVNVAVPNKT